MVRRHAEELGDIFARALFEQPEGNDRALDLTELRDARAEPDRLFGARDELFLQDELGIGELGHERVVVRTRAEMAAALVPCRIAHDGDEHGAELGVRVDLSRLHEIEQRAQSLLHAIDGRLRGESFVARDRRKRAALDADEGGEALERVGFGQGRGGHGCRGAHGHVHLGREETVDDSLSWKRSSRPLPPKEMFAMSKNLPLLNEVEFERLIQHARGAVLVDFTAAWCGPCKTQSAILANAAGRLGDAVVAAVDVDASPELAARFGVRGMPTLLVFKNGAVVGRRLGLATEGAVVALLAQAADATPASEAACAVATS